MKLIPIKEITSKKYHSRAKKALKISDTVELVLDTSQRKYFRVMGETKEHEVIYNKRKNIWICDCPYFTMKSKYCSHILSVHVFLQRK